MTRKAVLRSVRLDDDVWDAVKAMGVSLNQYLRTALLSSAHVSINLPPEITKQKWDQYVDTKSTAHVFKSPLLKPSEKKK